jgi:hypothetical protein
MEMTKVKKITETELLNFKKEEEEEELQNANCLSLMNCRQDILDELQACLSSTAINCCCSCSGA